MNGGHAVDGGSMLLEVWVRPVVGERHGASNLTAKNAAKRISVSALCLNG